MQISIGQLRGSSELGGGGASPIVVPRRLNLFKSLTSAPVTNSSIGYLLALLGEDDARMNGRPRDLLLESTM